MICVHLLAGAQTGLPARVVSLAVQAGTAAWRGEAATSPDVTCRGVGMREHWQAGGWRWLHLAGGGRAAVGGWAPGGWLVAWRTAPAFAAGILATLAGALVVQCRGPARADSAVTGRVVRWWAAVWLRAAGARVVVHGLEHVEPAATYVVVSNHQSNLDPMAHLQALPLSLRVLAMRELFQIPLLGRAMRTAGMIEVDRESPDFRQIDDAAARSLAAGHSLLVYPEGKASPDGTIGEFKDGAFIVAVTNQVPILPIAIHGTCQIWPPGRRAIHSGEVRIAVGRPLETSHLTHHDIAGLRDQARDVICSAHRDLVTTMSAKAVMSGAPPAK